MFIGIFVTLAIYALCGLCVWMAYDEGKREGNGTPHGGLVLLGSGFFAMGVIFTITLLADIFGGTT